MKKEIFINDKYLHFNKIIESLPSNFDSIGESIFMGRNYVRQVTIGDTKLVIKSFDHISSFNRLVYATIRKSKATRSYENSVKLLSKGINTPEPVGYLNYYKRGMLANSYYISLFTNARPLFDAFSQKIEISESIIRDFARFTLHLHKNGVYHNDYNVRNVLFETKPDVTNFTLIDNNRMTFGTYSYGKSIRNLKRTEIPEFLMGVFADEYAQKVTNRKLNTLYKLSKNRLFFRKFKSTKKSLKSILKR
jgi:tRNA A-37 threonylcarbamoyl transferase component Bud32